MKKISPFSFHVLQCSVCACSFIFFLAENSHFMSDENLIFFCLYQDGYWFKWLVWFYVEGIGVDEENMKKEFVHAILK